MRMMTMTMIMTMIMILQTNVCVFQICYTNCTFNYFLDCLGIWHRKYHFYVVQYRGISHVRWKTIEQDTFCNNKCYNYKLFSNVKTRNQFISHALLFSNMKTILQTEDWITTCYLGWLPIVRWINQTFTK